MIKISYEDSSATEFEYDGRSRRVKTLEKDSGGFVTSEKHYLWAGGNQPAEERDASNTVSVRYLAQGEQVPGASSPEDKLFYTKDHLGSVREVTDSSGEIRVRYAYDVYGSRTQITGDLSSVVGYTGHHHHIKSGLVLTWYRGYDPTLGRWLARDPFGERGGINLYGYVANNPINAFDPDGLADVKVNGQIWKTPIQGDLGHAHLYNGVDQGVHLHGPDGAKYFPQSNMMMDKNGNWADAGNKFRKQFTQSARCQLNRGMLNRIGVLGLLAAMVVNESTGETDAHVLSAINNINRLNQTGDESFAAFAAGDIQAAFQNDFSATLAYGQLMNNE